MPARVLIDVLNNLPIQVVNRISPETVQTKLWIKTSMVLLIVGASMMSGYMAMVIKMLGALLLDYPVGELKSALTVLVFMITILCIG